MNKKLCLTLFLVIALSAMTLGFETGTKSIGGYVAFTSYKPASQSQSNTHNSIAISPSFSYFVTKNLNLDAAIGLSLGWTEGQDNSSGYSMRLGFRYFYKYFYAGTLYNYSKNGTKGNKYSSQYFTLRAGRMVGIAKNVYLDFGLLYKIGIGKYRNPMFEADNESRRFTAQVGIQLFFK